MTTDCLERLQAADAPDIGYELTLGGAHLARRAPGGHLSARRLEADFSSKHDILATAMNHSAARPPGRRLYVADFNPGTVSVISLRNRSVICRIALGGSPAGVAVSRDGRNVYVTNYASDNVAVISTRTQAVTAVIPVGCEACRRGGVQKPSSGMGGRFRLQRRLADSHPIPCRDSHRFYGSRHRPLRHGDHIGRPLPLRHGQGRAQRLRDQPSHPRRRRHDPCRYQSQGHRHPDI